MDRTSIEFVLNAMYIAIVSAGMSDHQRLLANDTLFKCAELPCASPTARAVLERIGCNAVNQQNLFDDPNPPAPTRGHLRLVTA
jgi:hypothetical protein